MKVSRDGLMVDRWDVVKLNHFLVTRNAVSYDLICTRVKHGVSKAKVGWEDWVEVELSTMEMMTSISLA